MDPDRTTTIGDEEAVNTERPFHIMNAVERTRAKLRICASDCRVFDMLEERKDSMVGELGWLVDWLGEGVEVYRRVF